MLGLVTHLRFKASKLGVRGLGDLGVGFFFWVASGLGFRAFSV